MQDSAAGAEYLQWIGRGADTIEAIAVVLIVGYILAATCHWLLLALRRRSFTLGHYAGYRSALGRAMLLGLEILIAADVVRTAALDPSLKNILALGALVLVRTFLSWSIILEIEGRWPWQRGAAEEEGESNEEALT
jgi:uncharacterized membrane protein